MSVFIRLRTPIALLLLVAFLPGCVGHSWQWVEIEPLMSQDELPTKMRIATESGMLIEIEEAVQRHDSIAGWVASVTGEGAPGPAIGPFAVIAMADVVTIELWRLSSAKTNRNTFVGLAVIVGVFVVAWGRSW